MVQQATQFSALFCGINAESVKLCNYRTVNVFHFGLHVIRKKQRKQSCEKNEFQRPEQIEHLISPLPPSLHPYRHPLPKRKEILPPSPPPSTTLMQLENRISKKKTRGKKTNKQNNTASCREFKGDFMVCSNVPSTPLRMHVH